MTRKRVILLFLLIALSIILFFFIRPNSLPIIFLGVLLVSLVFSTLTLLASHDSKKGFIVGLATFFLMMLRSLLVLDWVTLSILIAFTVILSIFLLKKEEK